MAYWSTCWPAVNQLVGWKPVKSWCKLIDSHLILGCHFTAYVCRQLVDSVLISWLSLSPVDQRLISAVDQTDLFYWLTTDHDINDPQPTVTNSPSNANAWTTLNQLSFNTLVKLRVESWPIYHLNTIDTTFVWAKMLQKPGYVQL